MVQKEVGWREIPTRFQAPADRAAELNTAILNTVIALVDDECRNFLLYGLPKRGRYSDEIKSGSDSSR